ncbi:MAG TPA: glycerophosphodiester phosphodiesterase family protein [Gemmataceae bacterium]|nr:glycerophosphodiester phosphodiesterase family protein [Gemmataceae bacterium]
MSKFHVQGHRGSRGTCPENTLPSFEQALDAEVGSIETDIHLTRDGIPVLCHDPLLSLTVFRPREQLEIAPKAMLVRDLAIHDLREWIAAGNPNPVRFPDQRAEVTPVARRYAAEQGLDPFSVPTLADLFTFAKRYADETDKTAEQREGARKLIFDLEIKYIPFHAERYAEPSDIVERLLGAIQEAGMAARTTIRSFDHRLLKRVSDAQTPVATALLLAAGVPIDPARLVREAGASVFCPLFEYVDAELIRQCHRDGIRVLPWTVNEVEDWDRLLDWGVDGITTDFPKRLRQRVKLRQIRPN